MTNTTYTTLFARPTARLEREKIERRLEQIEKEIEEIECDREREEINDRLRCHRVDF